MKNNDTTQKILIIAIVIVSVCIIALLAIMTSLLLPEVFLGDSSEHTKTSQVVEAVDSPESEVTRAQQLESLTVLGDDARVTKVTSTQQEQHIILQTLSQ